MTGTTAKIITPQATIINAKAISTIAEMIEQSKRMSLLCSDDRTENMWVDDELVLHYTTEGEEKQTIMSRWSLSQLCTKIGIPVKYMYKCIDEQHVKLAQTNINEWLTEFNNSRAGAVIRKCYSENTEYSRGIVSERLHTLPRLLSEAEEYMTTLIDRNIKKKMSMKEVEECFEKIKKALKMSEDGIEKLGILREIYADEMGENSFAIVNALTDYSKDFAIDRRIEIETYAGKLFKAA